MLAAHVQLFCPPLPKPKNYIVYILKTISIDNCSTESYPGRENTNNFQSNLRSDNTPITPMFFWSHEKAMSFATPQTEAG